MKKYKRIFLLLLTIILLSGCTAKSNITMDAYGKIKEKVIISGGSDDISYDDDIVSNSINSYLDKYKSVLDFRGYNAKKTIKDGIASVTLTNNYKDICSYFQDTAFNQYIFKHINCTETDEYYEISNDTAYIPYCSDCSDWPALENSDLVLKLPVQATENDADSIDDKTYTWHFDKYTTSDKSIYIKISKVKLLKNKNTENNKNEVKRKVKITSLILICIIIIFALLFIILKFYKKYKSNKLNY